MDRELDGRLRLSGWLGSLVFHLLLILLVAPFLLRSPQFTVTTGKTSTEIELSADPEPAAVTPPQPPVPPTPPPVVPPLPSPPPPVIPPPAFPVKDSFVIPTPPKIIPSMPAPVVPKPLSHTLTKPHPVHKTATSESSDALKGAVEAQPDDLHNDPPVYPDESRMAHEEGVVILRVEVTAAGEAASVSIKQSSGYFRLDQAARQAVKHWRFHPGLVAGLPVQSEADVPVRFKLE